MVNLIQFVAYGIREFVMNRKKTEFTNEKQVKKKLRNGKTMENLHFNDSPGIRKADN